MTCVRLLAPVLCLVSAQGASLCAEVVHDEVIIVADPPTRAPVCRIADPPVAAREGVGPVATSPSSVSDASSASSASNATYAAVWTHPEQRFVDSDLGPLPLWTETVYDAKGDPRPRFPDVFTKAFLDDPSQATALAYLESQRVRARRYLEASQIMQETAVEMGYVTPEAFRPPKPQSPTSRALAPPYHLRNEDWGVPILTPEQARLDGLARAEIPRTPGKATTRAVELVYLWDHRCPFSLKGFRAVAELGEEVFQKELGPRVMTVSLDNDSTAVQTELDFLEYTGIPTKHLENWIDQTSLAAALRVRVTPTYVAIDRRSGRLERHEGLQDKAAVRALLLDLVGHGQDRWEERPARLVPRHRTGRGRRPRRRDEQRCAAAARGRHPGAGADARGAGVGSRRRAGPLSGVPAAGPAQIRTERARWASPRSKRRRRRRRRPSARGRGPRKAGGLRAHERLQSLVVMAAYLVQEGKVGGTDGDARQGDDRTRAGPLQARCDRAPRVAGASWMKPARGRR